jgi:choline dehydrogenase
MITSKSAFDKPAIDPQYYNINKDIEILQYGIEFARKLARTSPMSDRKPSFLPSFLSAFLARCRF